MSGTIEKMLSNRKRALVAQSHIELEQLSPLSPDKMRYHKDVLESAIEMNNYDRVIMSMSNLYDYRGIVMNQADRDGNTPLHMAVNLGKIMAVYALIASGVGMNPRNQARQTPLDVVGEDITMQKLLEAAGAVHGSELP